MRLKTVICIVLVSLIAAAAFAEINDAKEKYNAGIMAKQGGKLKEAKANFQEAITLAQAATGEDAARDSLLGNAYLELGTVEFGLDEFANAEQAFSKVIALDSMNQDAYYNLGITQTKIKKYKSAEKSLMRALEIKKGHAETQKALGQLYYVQDNWDKAIEYFKAYNATNTKDANSYFFIAKCYRQKGLLPEAETAYERATEIDSGFAMAYFNLGNLLSDQEKYSSAISAYRNAIQADKGLYKAHYNLAVAYQGAQMYEEALSSYKDFVRLAKGKRGTGGMVRQAEDIIPKLEDYLLQLEG
jgi:tetratricopeptide (TPR) repeat protein